MKKVICIISDRQNNYILDCYLVRIKRGGNIIDNKIPFAISKKEIANQSIYSKEIENFRKIILESFISNKYINTGLIIAIDTKDTIRDEIKIPIIKDKDMKSIVNMEVVKRYNIDYVKYVYKKKYSDYNLIKINLISKELKEFIDKIFIPMPFNIKKLCFQNEVILNGIKDQIEKKHKKTNYILVLQFEDKYITSVVINNILRYTYTDITTKELIPRIYSLYRYFENELDNDLILCTNDIMIKDLEKLDINVIKELIDNNIIINSLIYRKNYEYEKV